MVALQDWFSLSSQEVSEFQKQLAELESGLSFSDTAQQLREDIGNLKGKVSVNPLLSSLILSVL
jgi:hypothetical protein